MKLKVATSLNEIIESWHLVYHQYVAAALIRMNPFSIFTFPEYIGRNALVVLGKSGEDNPHDKNANTCTISAVMDSKRGLPLDSCFKKELDELRGQGRKLIEAGLLACSRNTASPLQTVNLLSTVARFGVFCNHHDYVIGVHPRRTEFLHRIFGFKVIGEEKVYHSLRRAEVALLHTDGQHFETLARKAMHEAYHTPTDLEFDKRFQFTKTSLLQSVNVNDYFINFLKKFKKHFLPPMNYPEPNLGGVM